MSKYKTNTWWANPRIAGSFIFLLLGSACFCVLWSLNDFRTITTITPASVFAFILSLLGGLFAAYAIKTPARLQQSVMERTAELESEIAERKTAEAELVDAAERLRQLSNYIENIREEERQNISKEIHDELGQYLTVLKMDVSRLGKKVTAIDASFTTNINIILESINKLVETVRKISSELRPGMLDDIGLAATLDWYCQDFSKKTGIKTSFNSDLDNDKFSQQLNTSIFRILQESLTNVVKHSEARVAEVSLSCEGHHLVLLIEDNGKGLDFSVVNTNKGLGILVMKERAMTISGTYNITSTPGKGTSIEVSVPLSMHDS
jgi:signal transduction histidine kinase